MSQPHTDTTPLQNLQILDSAAPQPLPVSGTVNIVAAAPVQVVELPARVSALRSTTVTDVRAERLVGAQPQRKRVVVLAVDQPIIVATTHALAVTSSGVGGFVLPAGMQLELLEKGSVWIRCSATGQTATVSYLVEDWVG